MKKMGMMFGLCLAMGLSTASFAGSKGGFPVTVDTVGRFFSGSMGTARNSTDSNQNLYCYTNSSGYGVCFATDSIGTNASCYTTNANLVSVIRSLNSDSYLQVAYDNTGACTSIMVGTGSHHDPKQP
ncbi:hypothetical protein JYK02_18380 [Corallococcus macrosporus]|uniref:Uncharacterized protein n=1 Tax=Corallococcus macrosporus TaxID=35 RepID=A0ABS3DEW7_9BACT|nr:hypothetical protein [Corallococcus macrosporus]MBN8229481.1 hypothetical protein [Corallococcus macrosporus]